MAIQRDLDDRIRSAAFAYLDSRGARDRPVTRGELEAFTFDGQRLPLLSRQQGIWKPRSLQAALSILTAYVRPTEKPPYDDDIGLDNYPRYKWRGTDPRAYDNVALREALVRKKPLVWFIGVASTLFRALYPVWLVDEEPDEHQFVVALDDAMQQGWVPGLEEAPFNPARRYAEAIVRVRLHQRPFRDRVLLAYDSQCSLCRLRHPALLDAAHIKEDSEGGEPIVPNGVAMCAIHHRAFDAQVLGVRPDYVIEIRRARWPHASARLTGIARPGDRVAAKKSRATEPGIARGALRALPSGRVMRAYIGVTDRDWYRFLVARPDLDEVNFWQPSGRRPFGAIQQGEPFLFKLHYPENAIVGGGTYVWSTTFPLSITWDAFEERNGAATRSEMRTRILRYRRPSPLPNEDPPVGSIILEDPFFFAEPDWIPAPLDWRPNIVQGKIYDLDSEIGRRVWDEVLLRRQTAWARQHVEPLAPMYGDPVLVRQRLGQGAFRMLVTDTYQRRCAVTKEKALPVLEAAHIRPVSEGGKHLVTNGLLLRSDVHTLFDRGYVTITPNYEFRASRRLRQEFKNGEDYFAMEEKELWLPSGADDRPSREFLEWHNDLVFFG